ncbi:MAG: hypothetical protein IKL51_05450, partial [Lachnospiraceae bacterium]|nr:hypothetical protein [Lachnospiraceae bacterium]
TLYGFRCIPKETADQIKALDEKKIEKSMRPYLDRAARFALLQRILELKKYASGTSQVIDINTEEGMKQFKKETMKMTVYSIIDNAETKTNEDTLRLQGIWGASNHAPSVLIRTLMNLYFFGFSMANASGKNDKYTPNDDYITDGMSKQEFYSKDNRRNFNNKLWVVFDAMMDAAGMTREQVWEEIEKLPYMQEKGETQKKRIKEAFLAGLTSWYGTFDLKPY